MYRTQATLVNELEAMLGVALDRATVLSWERETEPCCCSWDVAPCDHPARPTNRFTVTFEVEE